MPLQSRVSAGVPRQGHGARPPVRTGVGPRLSDCIPYPCRRIASDLCQQPSFRHRSIQFTLPPSCQSCCVVDASPPRRPPCCREVNHLDGRGHPGAEAIPSECSDEPAEKPGSGPSIRRLSITDRLSVDVLLCPRRCWTVVIPDRTNGQRQTDHSLLTRGPNTASSQTAFRAECEAVHRSGGAFRRC